MISSQSFLQIPADNRFFRAIVDEPRMVPLEFSGDLSLFDLEDGIALSQYMTQFDICEFNWKLGAFKNDLNVSEDTHGILNDANEK